MAACASLEEAVTGGEDYELLVCVPPGAVEGVEALVSWVGWVEAGGPGLDLRGASAAWRGYEHRLT
jgi:thiamine monophosphate kinase